MKCGCEVCKYYELKDGRYHCEWFAVRISKVFPAWVDDFRDGKIRFYACGYCESKEKVSAH
jgi:hypothetical protein